MEMTDILEAIQASHIQITDHADEAAHADQLTLDEILVSVLHGEIIEDYPADKPYPSCLIYGDASTGDASTVFGLIMDRVSGLS